VADWKVEDLKQKSAHLMRLSGGAEGRLGDSDAPLYSSQQQDLISFNPAGVKA
jgi:hypothetical protein